MKTILIVWVLYTSQSMTSQSFELNGDLAHCEDVSKYLEQTLKEELDPNVVSTQCVEK